MKSLFNIQKSILLKIFFIVQLTIVLICVMEYSTMMLRLTDCDNKAKKIFNTENIFTMELNIGPFANIPITGEALDKFFNFLESDKDIKLSTYNVSSISISDDKNIKPNYDNYLNQNFENNYYNDPDGDLPAICIDRNFKNIYDFKISEGEKLDFESLNANNDYIPVLAGEIYKQSYKLNDIINTHNKKYKIIGFLEKGQYFSVEANNPFLDYIFLDNSLVMPSNYLNQDRTGIKKESINNSIISYSNNDKAEIENRIHEYLRESNLDADIFDYSYMKQHFLYSYGIPKIDDLLLYGSLICCSIFGMSIMMLNNIYNRKKEIGIKLSVGYTKLKITLSFIKEAAFMIIVSYLLTLTYYKYFTVENIFLIKVTLKNSTLLAVICCIFLIIISLLPIRILLKFEPKDLIGGVR